MTTRKERLEKAKQMLSWSDGSDGDELEDEEQDRAQGQYTYDDDDGNADEDATDKCRNR